MGLVIDPVCGMQFGEDMAVAHSQYQDRTFYFCHPFCKRIFDLIPARFVYVERQRRSSDVRNATMADAERGME